MLYRRDKLTLVPGAGHDVEFNTIARSRHGNDKRLLNRLLRDNVAQASSGSLGWRERKGVGVDLASQPSPSPLHPLRLPVVDPLPSPPPPPSSLAPNPSPPPHPPPFRAPFCSFIALPGWPAQVVFLEMTSTGQPHPAARRQLCIANTHINASPEFADVKLWQTQHLLIEIERLLTQATGSTSAIPMVLAGDFNSLPGSDPHTRCWRTAEFRWRRTRTGGCPCATRCPFVRLSRLWGPTSTHLPSPTSYRKWSLRGQTIRTFARLHVVHV